MNSLSLVVPVPRLLDLAGVWWLIRRKRADPRPEEIVDPAGQPADQDVGC